MNRREALAAMLAFGAAPFSAEAQPAGKVFRIGFLRAGRPPEAFLTAFQKGLRELGYIDGQNCVIEYRLKEENLDQMPRLVEELMQLKVDVIVVSAAPPALAAQKVTKSLPVVFVGAQQPLELGLVSSLAHPGGNITGLSMTSADLAGKRLQLLGEIVPKLRRVAVLWQSANPANQLMLKDAEAAARELKVQLQSLPVLSPDDFEPAFKAARGADGLLVMDNSFFLTHRTRLVALAAGSRLPAIWGFRSQVEAGGLMSYGADLADLYRRAATYVDKILRGARPADLPVEQPAKFELFINQKTARTLGLAIPAELLLRADEVIE